MSYEKLRLAEASFWQRYPGGFADPGMASIKKKHDIDRLAGFAKKSFARSNFNRPELIVESLIKMVSRSSMVSRFEKPKLRDFLQSLNSYEREAPAAGLGSCTDPFSPNSGILEKSGLHLVAW